MSGNEGRPSLIEKAAQKLSGGRQMSLVEKAVSKMETAPAAPQTDPAETPVSEKPAAAAAPGPAQSEPKVAGTLAEPVRPAGAAGVSPAADEMDRPAVNIDLVKLQLAGFVTPNSERSRLVEEFRIIKRPLLNQAFAAGDEVIRNGNLIMVTSAGPNDGKTFTAINLAMSMASEQDIKVLLVDADASNRRGEETTMGVLGIPESAGLLDVLKDPKMDLAEVLLRTNVKNLTLLPAGRASINPTEMFASNRMGEIIEQLARRYADRLIIFDTPPVLATSEPGVLAMHVGQIVFVVEAERTSRRAIETSLGMISSCQRINLMLNKARTESGADKFGSYSYY